MAKTLKIYILNVGQGDTVVVHAPDDSIILVDCYNFTKVKQLLDYLGKSRIDLLVTTHPHFDHIKGVPQLLSDFEVKQWWDPCVPCASGTYIQIHQICIEKCILANYIGGANIFTKFGDLIIRVISPSTTLRKHIDNEVNANNSILPPGISFNDYSLILSVRYQNFNMILGADAEMATWSALQVELHDEIQCQALKIPHHGSCRGSHLQLIEKMGPQHVIISYGQDNPYGHPDQLTIDALERYQTIAKKNITIWKTPINGTILIESTGSRIARVKGFGEQANEAVTF